jgi:hypothetical protein
MNGRTARLLRAHVRSAFDKAGDAPSGRIQDARARLLVTAYRRTKALWQRLPARSKARVRESMERGL